MNREQAENILDAYLSMCYAADAGGGSDAKKAKASLREVILDAMTEYRSKPSGITVGSPWRVETVPCSSPSIPTNWDGTPKVTCTGLTVNGMEVFRVHHGPEAKVVGE